MRESENGDEAERRGDEVEKEMNISLNVFERKISMESATLNVQSIESNRIKNTFFHIFICSVIRKQSQK